MKKTNKKVEQLKIAYPRGYYAIGKETKKVSCKWLK